VISPTRRRSGKCLASIVHTRRRNPYEVAEERKLRRNFELPRDQKSRLRHERRNFEEIVGKRKDIEWSNDALIAATCKHYGIQKIATFDPDFEHVDFLEIVRE
jgi:predicted nucleic acid-binding protein